MPINWTQRVTPADYPWKAICYSPALGLFACVTDHNAGGPPWREVMTSPDGINWTLRTVPNNCNSDFYDIDWSPTLGLFCAVGDPWGGGFEFMTSPDGINWTGVAAPSVRVWNGIRWIASLGLFVAVGVGDVGAVATSPDGVNWTPQDMPVSRQWHKLAYSPIGGGQLVAVAFNGAQPQYARSVDAIAAVWAGINAPAGANWDNIVWASDRYLVISASDPTSISGTGLVFTSETNTPAGATARCIAFCPDYSILVVGGDSDPRMVSSVDLMHSWQTETMPVSGTWKGVIWVPQLGMFVACAAAGAAGTRIVTGELYGMKKSRRHRGGELWGIIPEVANYLG